MLVIGSYYLLDTRVALFFKNVWISNSRLSIFSVNIPDVLFPIVCLITGIAWAAYFYLAKKGIYNAHTRFFQLIAVSIPFTFFLKAVLKLVFGRINTRFWLSHPRSIEFHWFHGGGNYGSFPSGHMAVFMALVVALWRLYPRFRPWYIGFLSVLAMALIATDYHFVSDVIFGTYLGYCVDQGTHAGLTSLFKSKEENSQRGMTVNT